MQLEPGAVVAERFEVERLAGRGGAGAVFRARDRQSREWVALKVLRGQDRLHRSRFAREAAILAELRHPAVVRYVAHGEAEAGVWLAMEWLEGETLSARLGRGKLAPAEALALCADVAGALAAAHARGIVHRDLKPSNLFLVGGLAGAAPRVRVLDFGVARLLAQPMTRTGAIIGTPGYMAPEQVRGASEVDARADLFALGCVLFECLTGKRAFGGDQAMPILLRILLEEPPRLCDVDADLPEVLDALLVRLLAKAPADRPASAREVLAELGRIAQSGAGGDRRRGAAARSPAASSGRSPWCWRARRRARARARPPGRRARPRARAPPPRTTTIRRAIPRRRCAMPGSGRNA
ncbi:MAG: serine/threonine-protein kinase [Polyangiaceae bacterium]